MNYRDLLERHPDVLSDRYGLSFSRQQRPADIVTAFGRCGVVKLEQALPGATVAAAGEAFGRLVAATPAQRDGAYTGSWHSPWMLHEGDYFPAAAVMSAVIRSWAWDVVEELCGSSNIVLLIKWCTARHSVDAELGVGAHQDAKVVAAEVPFSIWIPLNPVMPGKTSGLGFVVPPPDGLLPTLPNDDVGADYVMGDPARLWIPAYALGDLSIHSRYSPHFTTGFGTATDRFSLEIRPMARHKTPADYLDLAAYVARRDGRPTIVETRYGADKGADGFFASADLSRVTSPEVRTTVY